MLIALEICDFLHKPRMKKLSLVLFLLNHQLPSTNNAGLQLERVVQFVNGIILTEALAENLTNVSTLAIDFLMMGRALESGDGGGGGLQTQKLRELIENGINATVETNKIPAMASVLNRIKVINEIKLALGQLEEFLASTDDDAMNLKLIISEGDASNFLKLPQIVEKLKDESVAGKTDDYLGLLAEAVSIPYKLDEAKISETLELAVEAYGSTDHKNSLKQKTTRKQLLAFLKKIVIDSEPHFGDVTFEAAQFLLDMFELFVPSLNHASFDIVANKLDEITKVHTKLNNIAKSMNRKMRAEDSKAFSVLMASLSSLRSVDLKGLNFTLQALAPAASKSSLSFKSYLGFENGIHSFKKMADDLVTNQKLPDLFYHAPINQRAEMAQKLAANIFSIAQYSAALSKVELLSSFCEPLAEFLTHFPEDLESDVKNLTALTKDLPEFEKVLNVLDELMARIELSVNESWSKNLNELGTFFPSVTSSEKIRKLLTPLPSYILLIAELNKTLGIYFMNTDEQTWDEAAINETFRKFTNHTLHQSVNIVNNISESVHGEGLEALKDSISNSKITSVFNNSALLLNWSEKSKSFKHSVEEIIAIPTEVAKIRNGMLAWKSNSDLIKKTSDSLQLFQSLTRFENETKIDESDESPNSEIMKLIEAVSKGSKELFTTIDGSTSMSEGLALLMNGSEYGADVLVELRDGLLGYKSLLNGLKSFESLKGHVAKLKGSHPDLIVRLQTLMDGSEQLDIFPASGSLNALKSLDHIVSAVDRLILAGEWIGNISSKEQKDITHELNRLMNSSTDQDVSVRLLHSFVSQLNRSTAERIGKLNNGLATVVAAFSYVNCTQVPNHRSCQEKEYRENKAMASASSIKNWTVTIPSRDESSNWQTVAGFVTFVIIAMIGLIGFVFYLRHKSKGDEKKRRSAVTEQLLRTTDFNSSIKNGQFSYLVEQFIAKYPDLLGLIWSAQLARCENPKNDLIQFEDPGTKSTIPLIDTFKVCHMRDYAKYNANYVHSIPTQKWIVSQSPRQNSQNIKVFLDMIVADKVDVVIQLGPNNEASFEGVDYTNWKTEKTKESGEEEEDEVSVVSRIVSKQGDKIVHKKLEIKSSDYTETYTVDHLHYQDWLSGGVPEDLYIPIELIEMFKEITKDKTVPIGLVHSYRGTGRSLLFASVAYVDFLVGEQRKLVEKKLIIDPLTDPRVIEGFTLSQLVTWSRTVRHNGLQSVPQYAYLELMSAYCCVRSNPGDEVLIERYKKLEEAFKVARGSGKLELELMASDELKKKMMESGKEKEEEKKQNSTIKWGSKTKVEKQVKKEEVEKKKNDKSKKK